MNHVPSHPVGLDAAVRRRRRAVLGTAVAGAGLLGVGLSAEPDSKKFYGVTLAVAGVWTTGALCSGPLHLGYARSTTTSDTGRRPLVTPVFTGAGAFGAFYAAALVAKRIPALDHAVSKVLRYADRGDDRLVLATALANGLAEELFFRGAVYAAVGPTRPVMRSTAAYLLATSATRNPALILASGAMGTVFALQRRATGGIQAPSITHLVWSALMLRFLPPLFRPPGAGGGA